MKKIYKKQKKIIKTTNKTKLTFVETRNRIALAEGADFQNSFEHFKLKIRYRYNVKLPSI